MKKQQIAIFAFIFQKPFGSEVYAARLMNELFARGHAVDFLFRRGHEDMLARLDKGIRLWDMKEAGVWAVLKFLVRYLKQEKPAVLLGVMEKPSLLALMAGCFCGYKNIIPTVHFDIDAHASSEFAFRRKILRRLIGFFYRLAPVVVTVSQETARVLRPWVGTKVPLVPIYNGFDLKAMRARAQEPTGNPAFEVWAQEHAAWPIIIGCGRLVPDKGFDALIRAFALLRARRQARLVIVGDGPDQVRLEKLIRSEGIEKDVMLTGFSENPLAYFSKSTLLAHSSLSEGFCSVLIESMAVGTPVVATDAPGGTKEMLREGLYGTLVPPNDDEALARALESVLKNPPEPSRLALIQAYLDQNYDLPHMGAAYEKVIEAVKKANPIA
ncbi:MAG: glycosyltransferase [Alphaproteobacteria bacterium]|nr:glycosyltransferase [Alphaproteobacteria bacterium]